MDRPLPGLLDAVKPRGILGVTRELGPRSVAVFLDKAAPDAFLTVVGTACQLWGGGAFALIPLDVTGQTAQIAPMWSDFLKDLDPDWVDFLELPHPQLPRGVGTHVTDPGIGEPLLAVAVNQERNPEDWRVVEVCDLESSDAWRDSYAVALGWLPTAPSRAILDAARFRPDLRFEDVLNIARVSPDAPGGRDLAERLMMSAALTPVQLSLMFLDKFPVQTGYHLTVRTPLFPDPYAAAERHGRQLIVVYNPANVEDLCLLWNLRAAHGQPAMAPIGIPVSDTVLADIDKLQAVYAAHGAQFEAGRLAVTSTSVDGQRLTDLVNRRYPVIEPGEVLRPWKRPARITSDVVTFHAGKGFVSAWAPSDRDRLGSLRASFRGGGLVSHLEVQPQPLPSINEPVALGGWPFPEGYRHGGWESKANDPNELLEMVWPDGWQMVASIARRLELDVRPSAAGLAAAALLRRVGGIAGVSLLLSPTVIATLERLSERKGMSWFRAEVRKIAAAANDASDGGAALKAIDDSLSALHLRPAEDEVRELTHGEVQRIFRNRTAASRWLEWAEDSGVLIRGVGLSCANCGDRYWRSVPEAVPPVTCRGCGRSIDRPFPADRLEFRYRASEIVTQAVSFDSLVHLLAMRWFFGFFHRAIQPSELFGMYPGVEFRELGQAQVLGEADVLLVMANGSLVPGECKRSGSGMNQIELNKLESLCERIRAPWSFIATGDRAAHCPDLWRDAMRNLPASPRFSMTGERLYERAPGVGQDQLGWKELTDQEWDTHDKTFAESIEETIEWLSRQDSD